MARHKQTENEFLNKLDRLPPEEELFLKVEKALSPIAEFYGFQKIYTPLVDDQRFYLPLIKNGFFRNAAPIFCRSKSGAAIFLRPSVALSLVRAYITHKMNEWPQPVKMFFTGDSIFSAGRRSPSLTARSELGLVMVGEESVVAETEIVQVIWRAAEKLGLKNEEVEVRINATGCAECRSAFRTSFTSHFRSRSSRLCKNCKKDLKKIPVKLLLCEDEKCRIVQNVAPQVLDFLCETCKKHLKGLLEFLDELKIPYFLDPRFFKEESLYNLLIFEFAWKRKLEPGTKAEYIIFSEGGRLSRAATFMAGKKLDVAAGSLFLGRVASVFSRKAGHPGQEEFKIFLVHLGELAKRKGLALLEGLRAAGVEARESLGRDSIKSQLKVAEKSGAVIALILGQKEALDNTIIVREIQSGIQETIPQEKLVEFLKKRLKK